MDPIWPLPGNSPWRRRREKPRSRPRPRPRDRPPRPARPRAQPEPRRSDRRGSPRRGGKCQRRGLLGLVVCELGGWGGQCRGAGARSPAACSREAGAEPGWERRSPRARRPVPWGEEWGAACAPGVSPPHRLPRRSLRMHWERQPECRWVACAPLGPGEAASASYVSRCPGPHLMLWSEPGRDPGRDPRVRPGGLPGQGTSLQLLSQQMRRMCSSSPGFVQ